MFHITTPELAFIAVLTFLQLAVFTYLILTDTKGS